MTTMCRIHRMPAIECEGVQPIRRARWRRIQWGSVAVISFCVVYMAGLAVAFGWTIVEVLRD